MPPEPKLIPFCACWRAGARLRPARGGRCDRFSSRQPGRSASQSGSAPICRATARHIGPGKTLKLRDWTLNDYILVARELKWIGEVAKDVSAVLRDYRNYIHPSKELANQMSLTSRDTSLMWTIFVTLTDQILKSVATRTP